MTTALTSSSCLATAFGAAARYRLEPNTAYVQIVNRVTTGSRSQQFLARSGQQQDYLRGHDQSGQQGAAPTGLRWKIRPSIRPQLLREILLSRGIRVYEEAFEIDELPGAPELNTRPCSWPRTPRRP